MLRKFLIAICFISLLAACGQEEQETTNEPNETDGETQEEVNDPALDTNVNVSQEDGALLFYITLLNTGEEEVELTFPNGQHYEIIVENKEDKEVYRYSEGKSFTQAVVTEHLPAGEELSFQDKWEFENIESGTYTVKVQLQITSINGEEVSDEAYSATQDVAIETENTAFRNVEVTGEGGNYTVTGEARVFEGMFYYSVEEGHEYLIEETSVQVEKGAPNWSSFELDLSIPKQDLPVNGTLTLELYERSAKDGLPSNVYLVKLEQIKKDIE